MKQILLRAGILTVLLCSCAPKSTLFQTPLPTAPTEIPTAIKTQIPASMTPLDWINSQPFATVPDTTEVAMVTSGLEEGFVFRGAETDFSTLESGHMVRGTTIRYDRTVGQEVANEDMIAVIILSYSNQEDRSVHLQELFTQEHTWSFWEEGGHQVVRIKADESDFRLWVSGAYVVMVGNRIETSDIGPWLEIFVPLYMALYPPN